MRFQSLLSASGIQLSSGLGRWLQAAALALDTYVVSGAQPYLTQASWYVDNVAGNDANDGSISGPLKTVGELQRRWAGRTFAESVSAVNVYLAGFSSPTESLSLGPTAFAGLSTVKIYGETTELAAGSITAYQAAVPASDIRATLTDAGADFTSSKWKRLRVTSGTKTGAITWITSLGGATVANIGQFWSQGTSATYWLGDKANPAPGDAYVVEDLGTFFDKHMINFFGEVRVEVHDVGFVASVITDPNLGMLNISNSSCGNRSTVIFHGCSYDTTASFYAAAGKFSMVACAFVGTTWTFAYQECNANERACCFGVPSQVIDQSFVASSDSVHDGDGARHVGRGSEASWMIEIGPRGFFGNVNGLFSAHMTLFNFTTWTGETSSSRVWGSAGNTVTQAWAIANGCAAQYTVKPTAFGVTPGNDVKLADEAVIAYGAIPAKAATATNNAYFLQRL